MNKDHANGSSVVCDAIGISCERKGRKQWRIEWSQILRVAYATEDTGIAITDDHFLVIETEERLHLISTETRGCTQLEIEVRRRFPFTLGPKEILCGSVDNDSVVVWPAADAGRDIYEVSGSARHSDRIPVTYALSERA